MRYTLIPGGRLDLPVVEVDDRLVLTGPTGRRYLLGATPLGEGAQAEVWPAVEEGGGPVAVKLSRTRGAAAGVIRGEARILTEVAAAGVRSVIPCLDTVEHEGRAGFVMPLYASDVEARVRAAVAADPARGVEAILEIVGEVARALDGLHRATLGDQAGHLVHRDIKPENVLVGEDGAIHLADFGGSLVADGMASMALGIFGSPMWAPFDQMLPGLPEPNPTWDTYACCVMLFWWLTDRRPVYQDDPAPMLTERGRATWQALCDLAEAVDPEARRIAHGALTVAREGTRAAELVDVRGHGAIQDADRAALAAGVAALAAVEVYGAEAITHNVRDLGELLARGLSPLAHPSPPNRFWSAGDLANETDAIRRRFVQAREARVGEAERAALRERVHTLETTAPRRRGVLVGVAAGGIALLGLAAALSLLWFLRGAAETGGAAEVPPDVVEVAAGGFVAGDTRGDGETDERPVRTLSLPAFRIHRTEVDTRDYLTCVDAGVCTAPAWKESGTPWEMGKGEKGGVFVGLVGDEQPIVGVTWMQASSYCAYVGGRLPTEWEWEKAATWAPDAVAAVDKRAWPWGNTPPECGRANLASCGRGRTGPVDGLEAGASAWGALNMTGNAWEWTSSVYEVVRRNLFRRVVEEHRVLRGGAWSSDDASARPTFRRHYAPDRVSELHSFRCAFDP